MHTILQQGVPHLTYGFCQETCKISGKKQTKMPCMDGKEKNVGKPVLFPLLTELFQEKVDDMIYCDFRKCWMLPM